MKTSSTRRYLRHLKDMSELTDQNAAGTETKAQGGFDSRATRYSWHGTKTSTHTSRWSPTRLRPRIFTRTVGKERRGYQWFHRRELGQAPKVESGLGGSYLATNYSASGAGSLQIHFPSSDLPTVTHTPSISVI